MFSSPLALVIVGGLIALPLLLGIFMRVSASNLFFSVMAGELLAHYFGHDAFSVLDATTRNTTIASYAEPILLTLPVILTAVFLKGTLSKSKAVLNFVPLVVTGVVYAAFMLPILPVTAQQVIRDNPQTEQFLTMNTLVIGFVVFFQLVALWILNRGEGDKHGRKHKK